MFGKQIQNTTLLWIGVGVIAVIIVLASGYFWLASDPINTNTDQKTTTQPALSQTEPTTTEIETDSSKKIISADPVLVDDTLLTNQIPENPTLAKEEIARLDDIQKQLNQQNETLKGQHQDADQLIQLKEEQIKLLEQELAAQQQ